MQRRGEQFSDQALTQRLIMAYLRQRVAALGGSITGRQQQARRGDCSFIQQRLNKYIHNLPSGHQAGQILDDVFNEARRKKTALQG